MSYIHVLFRAKTSAVMYSQHFTIWGGGAVLIVTCCKKKFLSRLNMVLIYGYGHKYLEGSFTICLFRKTSKVATPRVWDLSSHRLLTRFTVLGTHSFLWNRPIIQSESGWLPHPHQHKLTTIAQVDITGPAGQDCSTQGPQMDKILGGFLPSRPHGEEATFLIVNTSCHPPCVLLIGLGSTKKRQDDITAQSLITTAETPALFFPNKVTFRLGCRYIWGEVPFNPF